MNDTIFLDFELTQEQVDALNLHLLFKQKGTYGYLDKGELIKEGIDKIRVWFDISYNDNTYDVNPIYMDLIKGDKIVRKSKCHNYSEVELPEYSGGEGYMQSFIITPKML